MIRGAVTIALRIRLGVKPTVVHAHPSDRSWNDRCDLAMSEYENFRSSCSTRARNVDRDHCRAHSRRRLRARIREPSPR